MFIRKRDPRYKSHLSSQAAAAAAKASTRSSGQSTPRKQTQVTSSASAFVEQDWQKASGSKLDDADLEWAAAENGEDAEEWECVACGKTFRSEAAWDSHERSKKHLQAVERLKREMLEEDEELGLDAENVEDENSEDEPNTPDEEDFTSAPQDALPSPNATENTALQTGIREDEDLDQKREDAEEGKEAEEEDAPSRSRKKKKTKKPSRAPSPEPLARSARKARGRRATSPDLGLSTSMGRLEVDETHTAVPANAEEDPGEAVALEKPELSKRDKRRAREAAKKAKEEQDGAAPVVSLLIMSPYIGILLLTVRSVMSARRCFRAAQSCSPISAVRGTRWPRRQARAEG